MNLDPRTLLFALILTNALMAVSLFVASSRTRRDGTLLWAMGMVLETLGWMMAAARGAIPDAVSLIFANGCIAGAHALALAAISEFQHRPLPRWQYFVPVVLAMLMAALQLEDTRGRFFWGSLIYAFQMVLIARMLLTDPETRAGRAWRLLFAGLVGMLLVLALRAGTALSGYGEIAQPQSTFSPHPVQILTFISIMATALIGSVAFILMVKERTDREILELAMTDSLTGIPNRRALMELAEHALARRGSSPMTLMMIDVDHFKRINDTYGHPTGDAILRQVTRLLAGRLRGGDVLGRYGGEEFCVLAPDTDDGGALTLAESLREIISFKTLAIENGAIQVTVSVGVACCRADSSRDLKDLLAEADAALYAAKEAGRNRVVSFTC